MFIKHYIRNNKIVYWHFIRINRCEVFIYKTIFKLEVSLNYQLSDSNFTSQRKHWLESRISCSLVSKSAHIATYKIICKAFEISKFFG